AGISATLGKWDISAAATWHSGWPKTELYLESVPDGGGNPLVVATTSARNSLDYESFHTLDARASRTFQLAHGELEAFVEVSNIYNHENECCLSYSLSADESGNPLLRTNQDFWLPLVPSLGVVWKF
ncbi:MAG: hypothetical protein KJO31_18745, partial [Gammaproteobacteria bacterium]|nr:hypothetical protein [Gammaproteobacteria bacterium]